MPLMFGENSGNVRSTAKLPTTDRTVKLDPIPRFFLPMQIPVNTCVRRLFSGTSNVSFTTSPGLNGITLRSSHNDFMCSRSKVSMMCPHRLKYDLRFFNSLVGVHGNCPPPALPHPVCVAPASKLVIGASSPRSSGLNLLVSPPARVLISHRALDVMDRAYCVGPRIAAVIIVVVVTHDDDDVTVIPRAIAAASTRAIDVVAVAVACVNARRIARMENIIVRVSVRNSHTPDSALGRRASTCDDGEARGWDRSRARAVRVRRGAV